MQRQLVKYDEFLVWIIKMDRGERKRFLSAEVNRGLRDHGPTTLWTIPVYVRGSFQTVRHGGPPIEREPGDGGANCLWAESFLGAATVAMEDNSEYHCITPRETTPSFWERTVFKVKAGSSFCITSDSWVYTAAGSLARNGKGIGTMAKIRAPEWIKAETDSIVALVWK